MQEPFSQLAFNKIKIKFLSYEKKALDKWNTFLIYNFSKKTVI